MAVPGLAGGNQCVIVDGKTYANRPLRLKLLGMAVTGNPYTYETGSVAIAHRNSTRPVGTVSFDTPYGTITYACSGLRQRCP